MYEGNLFWTGCIYIYIHMNIHDIPSLKLTARTWKWMLRRWSFPFKDGLFQLRKCEFEGGYTYHCIYTWIFQACKICAFSPKKPPKKHKFYIYMEDPGILYIYSCRNYPACWTAPTFFQAKALGAKKNRMGFFGSGDWMLMNFCGVHHKDLLKWENRAPKDWQVAFVPWWWFRVSPIFIGLFQVMKWQTLFFGDTDWIPPFLEDHSNVGSWEIDGFFLSKENETDIDKEFWGLHPLNMLKVIF